MLSTLNRFDVKTTLTHDKINYFRLYEHLSVIIYLWCCFWCNIVTYAFYRNKNVGCARIPQGYECLRLRQVKPISLFIPLDINTKHVYVPLTIQSIALCIMILYKAIVNILSATIVVYTDNIIYNIQVRVHWRKVRYIHWTVFLSNMYRTYFCFCESLSIFFNLNVAYKWNNVSWKCREKHCN